jgi:hypothetical protein
VFGRVSEIVTKGRVEGDELSHLEHDWDSNNDFGLRGTARIKSPSSTASSYQEAPKDSGTGDSGEDTLFVHRRRYQSGGWIHHGIDAKSRR